MPVCWAIIPVRKPPALLVSTHQASPFRRDFSVIIMFIRPRKPPALPGDW